jgi:hypothetical protein
MRALPILTRSSSIRLLKHFVCYHESASLAGRQLIDIVDS